MSVAHVVGVDPGLVDTGVVSLRFRSAAQVIEIEHSVVPAPVAQETRLWINALSGVSPRVYVEQYRPRQRLNTDLRMLQVEQDMRRFLPGATFLTNMGIKRVITEDLMRMLSMWSWSSPTHHQDLRSAARIALLGMVKDERLNQVLADVTRDHLDSAPWAVHHV